MDSRPLLQDRIENLYIVDKRIQTVKLRLNWAQLDMLRKVEHQLATQKRIRIIILKARQLGMSTFTEAFAFTMAMMIQNYRVLIVTHEREASENILAMTKLFWDQFQYKALFTPKSDSRFESSWVETRSAMRIATAGQKGSAGVGRSKTTHFLHLSELAFWPDPETAMLSLLQTMPETALTSVVIESTANGMGNYYHSLWESSVAGDTEYLPLFYPWWQHPEYTATNYNIPLYTLTNLSTEEHMYRHKLNVDDDHLIWRRWMIANKCNGDVIQFMQEYPATPEEAFMTTGLNVFPLSNLKAIYHPEDGYNGYLQRNGDNVSFSQSAEGPLKIFALPGRNPERDLYVVAGDPTRTVYGDYACAQVINRRTLEQVAVYRAKTDPTTFAEELFKLGIFYNNALLTTEVEGGGYATIGALVTMDYPNLVRRERPDSTRGKSTQGAQYGWSTTSKSKALAIGWTQKMIKDRDVIIHDGHTFSEMKNYVTKSDGSYGPADDKNGHDDTVMSYCVALTTHVLDGVLQPYEGASPIQQSIEAPAMAEHDDEPDWMNWRAK